MRRNVGFTSGAPQLLREVDMSQGQLIRDASHLYEAERRVQHAARPDFRLWSCSSRRRRRCRGTITPISPILAFFLQDPKEEVNLKPGEIHAVRAARPHLVTKDGTTRSWFYEYDYVPLTSS